MSIGFTSIKRPFTLEDIVLVGKYKGQTIKTLLDQDRFYAACMMDEGLIKLDQNARQYYLNSWTHSQKEFPDVPY